MTSAAASRFVPYRIVLGRSSQGGYDIRSLYDDHGIRQGRAQLNMQ